ncbi:hypothetical protein [Streptomyces cylindrosporus]|uniref:Nucleotidyltransferase domain-containing protein n=1 Tax=Streptomyces cylindrosporus TaxID=2927583 RepID=A0ABS9YQ69_9ACTN|nr:hypothetical protein [Streptomyces cylindrosporus]MCI3278011.1 hypothetical protein [Streptomyces cylindrosporus]
MSTPPPLLGATPDETLAAFVTRARADPGVVGLVLSGSQVHDGMVTALSDHDLHVVLRDRDASPLSGLDWFRSGHLDLVVLTLDEFRRRGLPGDAAAFSRYSYVHAKVLLDRLDGEIGAVLDRKRVLEPDEARAAAAGHLDAYVNQTYRSLKSFRDGRDALGHLDAAESVPYALEVVFALHRRVRPYNKYLRWELERQPLGDRREWSAERLLDVLRRILADGDPAAQRALFQDIERAARGAGHGDVLDAWGDDLRLLRPPSLSGGGPAGREGSRGSSGP